MSTWHSTVLSKSHPLRAALIIFFIALIVVLAITIPIALRIVWLFHHTKYELHIILNAHYCRKYTHTLAIIIMNCMIAIIIVIMVCSSYSSCCIVLIA